MAIGWVTTRCGLRFHRLWRLLSSHFTPDRIVQHVFLWFWKVIIICRQSALLDILLFTLALLLLILLFLFVIKFSQSFKRRMTYRQIIDKVPGLRISSWHQYLTISTSNSPLLQLLISSHSLGCRKTSISLDFSKFILCQTDYHILRFEICVNEVAHSMHVVKSHQALFG